jgi:SAM-dependent methyltransferase
MFTNSAHIYDAVYSFKDYEAESRRLRAVIEERSPGAATLLDVACGTGKHLEQLRAWYEVSGLDLDSQLLALARERLAVVELHEGDMTAFSLGRRFDVVTCLFSSIGYVGTVERKKGYENLIARFGAERLTLAGRNHLGEPVAGTYLGPLGQEELPALYNRARTFAHLPEWYEPMGRTVAEAALCGCELVTNERVGVLSYDRRDWADPAVVATNASRFWADLEAAVGR